MKEVINKFLRIAGVRKFDPPCVLQRLTNHIPSICTVIDVGASDGRWSVAVEQIIQANQFLLIEANKYFEPALASLKEKNKKFEYTIAAAGHEEGEVHFQVDEIFGGAASKYDNDGTLIKMVTIDALVQRQNKSGPFLIKLDTHGFEVPIIEGAKATLLDTAVLIVECYNQKLSPSSLRFWEFCSYMEGLGFLPVDIMEPTLREYDKSFWQMDIVFLRADNKVFQYTKYR